MAKRRSCPRPKPTTSVATAVARVLTVVRAVLRVAVAAPVPTVAPVLTLLRRLLLPQRRPATARRVLPSSAFAALRLPPLAVRPKENNDAATRTSQVPQGTQGP